MNAKKIAIVFNPKGGSASKSRVETLAARFVELGSDVVLLPTTRDMGSATALARNASQQGHDLVIAVGGDGTACGVAEGLRGTNVPMAVFPGGTGNLFARSFYSLPTTERFVEMVKSGDPQAIDMVRADYRDLDGNLHNKLFMVGFGVGKVSDAISHASPMFKRIFGQLVYVLKVAIACIFTDYRRLRLAAAGSQSDENAAALFALNVTPPGMHTISRGCNCSDGLIDVVILRARSVWGLVAASFWLVLGKPERSKHYHRIRTKQLSIASTVPMLPNIDGDPAPETYEVRLTVEPGAVRMILS